MTKIYVNLYTTTNTAAAPWTDNAYGSGSVGLGVLTADLLDDTSSSTGIGLEVINAFTGAAGSTGVATADNVWPKEVFDIAWYTDGTDGSFQLSGLTDGDSYTIEVAGHTSNASRDTDFTVEATTLQYDSAGTGVPNAPISFSGTVSGTTLDITAAVVSVFGYVNGFSVEITPAAGPTTSDIVLNGEATHEVIQTMIATANTTTGESIFGTGLIAVEDDMQAYVVKAVNGMNITWAADGTFTTDANQTEVIDVAYFSPATGQWSCLALTISEAGVISGIPPENRTSINKIADALRATESYTHEQTNDIVYEWLLSEGLSRASLNGMLYGYLGGLGYTGTIDERMKKWSNDA